MRLAGTKLAANHQYRGFGDQLYDLSGQRPSLDLNFANTKSLVDATTGQNLVTFTRASSGTYVDSQGVIQRATTNLLLQSEDFSTTWATSGAPPRVGITVNQTAAPNGANTADLAVPNAVSNDHVLFQSNIINSSSTVYTQTLYAKAAGYSCLQLLFTSAFNNADAWANFILTGAGSVGFTGSATTATIEALPNGWYRCRITASSGTSVSNAGPALIPLDSNRNSRNPTFTGDGTSGIYVWGAQLEQSSTVGEYIPTTSTINSAPRFDHNPTTGESLGLLVEESRTNLVTWSQDFSQADWSKAASTVVTTAVASPIQGVNYQKIEATSANTTVGITSVAVTAATQQRAVSFFAQPLGNISRVLVVVQGADARININLADGTFVTNAAATGSTVSVSGQRFSVSTPTLTNATGVRFFLKRTGETDTNTPTTIAIGEGLYLIGAQMEAGAFPTSYIPTTTATVTRSADVASITGSNFVVSRTNLLLRSEEFNDAYWIRTGAGLTVDAINSPTGVQSADFLVPGLAVSEQRLRRDVSGVSPNTAYTLSVFAKAGGYNYIAINHGHYLVADHITYFDLQAGTVATSAAGSTPQITALGNGWYRCSVTRTTTASQTTISARYLAAQSDNVPSFAGDGTSGIYLWGAQLETGSTATAYIPTTTAAVTVFESPWYRQDEGTMFGDSIFAANTNTRLISANTNATSNRVMITRGTGSNGNFNFVVTDAGVVQVNSLVLGSNLAAGSSNKVAAAYKATDFAGSVNGSTAATQQTGTVPLSLTQLTIGNGESLGGNTMTGTIRRLAYFPTRLANETLQRITQ